MKMIKQIIGLSLALLFFAVNVFAVDLKNEDSQRYEIKIHEGSTTLNTWIDGNTTSASICSDCEIEVVGVGKIKAKGSEKVVIKDGKLSKQ